MWQNRSDIFYSQEGKALALFITRPAEKHLGRISERYRIFFNKQIHSNNIIDLDEKEAAVGDGLVTSRRNVFIGVKVADCLPIYFVSSNRVGIAHAGWRGTLNRVALKMLENFRDKPSYFFGPCINPCCYEVKPDLYGQFKNDFPESVFTVKDNGTFLDLKAANRYLLKDLSEAGSLDLCTSCNPELFYSYRRDKELVGRNFALIGMVDKEDFL